MRDCDRGTPIVSPPLPEVTNNPPSERPEPAEVRGEAGGLIQRAWESAARRADQAMGPLNEENEEQAGREARPQTHADVDAVTPGEGEVPTPAEAAACGADAAVDVVALMADEAAYIDSCDDREAMASSGRCDDVAAERIADSICTGFESADAPEAEAGEAPPTDVAVAEAIDRANPGDGNALQGNASEVDPSARGLLHFMKWWYLRRVGISVHGELLIGIPAFIEEDAMRIFGDQYSYIVPMRNIDYIRAEDGLRSIEAQLDDCGV